MKGYVILRYGDKILKLLLLASMMGDFFLIFTKLLQHLQRQKGIRRNPKTGPPSHCLGEKGGREKFGKTFKFLL